MDFIKNNSNLVFNMALNSPTAYTLTAQPFYKYEELLIKQKIILYDDATHLATNNRITPTESIKFLKNLGMIEKVNEDYVLNEEIEDEVIKNFFSGKWENIDKHLFRLLFLYRMKINFPFFYEALKIYFKKIWIVDDNQKNFNLLDDNNLKQESIKNYDYDDVNFTPRHVRSVINPIFKYLGLFHSLGKCDFNIIKINSDLFNRLLFKNKSKGKYSILDLINFFEKFIPVIEIKFSENQFKIFQIIRLKLQNLRDNNIHGIEFVYEADSYYINFPNKEETKFISHIKHEDVE